MQEMTGWDREQRREMLRHLFAPVNTNVSSLARSEPLL